MPLIHFKKRSAILDSNGRVLRTFTEIEAEAREFERTLFHGFRPGEVIAIQVGNHASWPALLIASLRCELVVVPIEPTISERELAVALGVCSAAAVLRATAIPDTLDERIELRSLRHDSIDWGIHRPSLLKLTSGTTALPRAIRFRSGQLLADCNQICQTMGITQDDLNFGVISVSHSYGFSNLITPLLARGVTVVLTNDRLPRAVLNGLARTNATVFPGMPLFYQAFAEMKQIPALPRLRLCISAGAPLPLTAARKFRDRFGLPIHSFYGSSECGGICYDRVASLSEEGFVGQPLEGVNLELAEPHAATTSVKVQSPAVGDGYFPDQNQQILGEGQFIPGDLLSVSENGFRIVGRTSDIINVAGKKVHPAEVEAELLCFDGVRAAVVFGRESTVRNQEVAACVVAGEQVNESNLLEHCRARLSGWQVPKRIFFVDQIPVNERGKINRRELGSQFGP